MGWQTTIASAKENGAVGLEVGGWLTEVRYMAREGDSPGDTPAWEVNRFVAYQLVSTAWPRDDDALIAYLDSLRKPGTRKE